jgi:hypothetical protein
MKFWFLMPVLFFVVACGPGGSAPKGDISTGGNENNLELQAVSRRLGIAEKWEISPGALLDLSNASLTSNFFGELKTDKITCSVERGLYVFGEHFIMKTKGQSALSWPRPYTDCRGVGIGLCARVMADADSRAAQEAALRCAGVILSQRVTLLTGQLMEICDYSSSATNCQVLAKASSASDVTASSLINSTGAVAVSLTDKINFSGLAAIAAPVPLVAPVVGDPKVLLKISQASQISGTIGIGFEHNTGFWSSELNSVEGTGQNTTNNFEVIFSDSQLTFRVSALKTTPNGNNFNAELLYRVRQANETQCLPAKCSINWYGQNIDLPLSSCFSSTTALEAYKESHVTECKNYMAASQTQVKNLGTFSGQYSNIAVLPMN